MFFGSIHDVSCAAVAGQGLGDPGVASRFPFRVVAGVVEQMARFTDQENSGFAGREGIG